MLDRLSWYGKRLRAMSMSEIAGRSVSSLEHLGDAVTFHAARSVWRSRWEPAPERLLGHDVALMPTGFLTPERASGLQDRLPAEAAELVRAADRWLERRVTFFGYPAVRVDSLTEDVDPFSSYPWPSRHAMRIDYRRAPADPKWIWELNRCQGLPVLVAAWLLTREDRYADAAAAWITAWIRAHPPGRGIAWSNGLEAGIRAIALALTLDALRGSKHLSRTDAASSLRSLWQHARWIEREPASGSSANNHRIGELVGLVVVGALAPELADSRRWLAAGLDGLDHELEMQIRPDGTNAEQAFAYQLFVADLLLVAAAVLAAVGEALPRSLAAALDRSGSALSALLDNDEPAPTYGDADDGRGVVLDGRDLRHARGIAAGIAASVGHPGAARVAGTLDATAWWLFGEAGAERFDAADRERAAAPESVTLAAAGISILRAAGRRTTFDHGPHGYLSLAAHAHADALRIDLSYGAQWLVADPGVGSYFARPEVRRAFRGTGFHATVEVDDVDSSVSGGPFLWTRHARSRLLRADLEEGVVVAEHDGYERLDDPVQHRRAVVSRPNGALVVVDRLRSGGSHVYRQRWPLHPSLEACEKSGSRAVARGASAGLVLVCACMHPIVVRTFFGHADPFAGWWSERLEATVPSWLVSFDVEAAGAVEIVTLVVPFDSDAPPDADVEFESSGTRVQVRVSVADTFEEVDVDLAAAVADAHRAVAAGAP